MEISKWTFWPTQYLPSFNHQVADLSFPLLSKVSKTCKYIKAIAMFSFNVFTEYCQAQPGII